MPTSNKRPEKPRNRSNKPGNRGRSRPNTSNKRKQNPKGANRKSNARRSNDRKTSGGAPRKYTKRDSSQNKESLDPIPGNREWGGLARKGVLRVYHDDQRISELPVEAKDPIDPEDIEREEERKRRREKRDRRQEELRLEAKAALARAKGLPSTTKRKTPKPYKRKLITRGPYQYGDLQPRFRKAFGEEKGKKYLKFFHEVVKAFGEERFEDAVRKIRPLMKVDHKIPEVYELFGLITYRKGEYVEAAQSLEKFRSFGSSTEQHPVLMDCYRDDERWNDIDFLWDELREISPSGPLVVEGRIVMAGALADRGSLKEAVRLLEKGWKPPKRPRDHHLRRAYALADLYDRAGNIPRAREIFAWITKFAPDFVDASERLKNLR
tara:strand:- start:2484 stop:3623 length:1140 start_codon:yes stop_codon:yes gene_type:complete